MKLNYQEPSNVYWKCLVSFRMLNSWGNVLYFTCIWDENVARTSRSQCPSCVWGGRNHYLCMSKHGITLWHFDLLKLWKFEMPAMTTESKDDFSPEMIFSPKMIRQLLFLEEVLLELFDFQLHENKQTSKVRQRFTIPKEKRAMLSQRTSHKGLPGNWCWVNKWVNSISSLAPRRGGRAGKKGGRLEINVVGWQVGNPIAWYSCHSA